MPPVSRSDFPYPLRTVDGQVDGELDSLVVTGDTVLENLTVLGNTTIGGLTFTDLTCETLTATTGVTTNTLQSGSVTASGAVTGSTVTSSGLLRGAVVKADNLTAQQITYADASLNLQSIPSGASGLVLTSNGAAAPSFQEISTAAITGVLPIINGGTGSTTATGSGQTVLATAPSLVDPFLGDAEANTLHTTSNIGCDTKIFTNDIRVLSATASSAVQTNALKDLVTINNTGTGNNVLSANPTITGTATMTNINSSGTISGLVGQFSNMQVASSLTLQAATAYSTVAVNNIGVCQSIGPGTAGQVLTSTGTGTLPTYSAIPATNLATGVTGVLPVLNGGTGLSTPGLKGQYLGSDGINPVWTTRGPYFFVTNPKIITVSTTLTAAELCGMVIFQNGAAGAITLTMPTAASIIAILGTTTNTFVSTKLIQQTTQRAFTFVTNTGVTLDQGQINNASGFTFYFLVQVTSPTTVYITMSSN